MSRYAPYGVCPTCNQVGVTREKRPSGNDTCAAGHEYPSASAITSDTPDPKAGKCRYCQSDLGYRFTAKSLQSGKWGEEPTEQSQERPTSVECLNPDCRKRSPLKVAVGSRRASYEG